MPALSTNLIAASDSASKASARVTTHGADQPAGGSPFAALLAATSQDAAPPANNNDATAATSTPDLQALATQAPAGAPSGMDNNGVTKDGGKQSKKNGQDQGGDNIAAMQLALQSALASSALASSALAPSAPVTAQTLAQTASQTCGGIGDGTGDSADDDVSLNAASPLSSGAITSGQTQAGAQTNDLTSNKPTDGKSANVQASVQAGPQAAPQPMPMLVSVPVNDGAEPAGPTPASVMAAQGIAQAANDMPPASSIGARTGSPPARTASTGTASAQIMAAQDGARAANDMPPASSTGARTDSPPVGTAQIIAAQDARPAKSTGAQTDSPPVGDQTAAPQTSSPPVAAANGDIAQTAAAVLAAGNAPGPVTPIGDAAVAAAPQPPSGTAPAGKSDGKSTALANKPALSTGNTDTPLPATDTPLPPAAPSETAAENKSGGKTADAIKVSASGDDKPVHASAPDVTPQAQPDLPAPVPHAVAAPVLPQGMLTTSFGAAMPATGSSVAAHTIQITNADAGPAPNLDTLAVSIVARSLSGAKQFEIRLDPPELGRVDVRLSIDASGKTQAHMTADQPQTLNLLQKDATSLTQALRDAGLDVSQSGLNFSLRGQDHQNDDSNNGGASGRRTNLTATRIMQAAQSPTAISFNGAAANARVDIHV